MTKGENHLATNIYTTISGDEWDGICYKFYGENGEMMMDKVIHANPSSMYIVVFPAGVVLTMPVFDLQKQTAEKPPWMR